MKKLILIITIAPIILSACENKPKPETHEEPKTEAQTLYDDNFKWTITIPENFVNVPPEEWEKMQKKGERAIEDTYGEDIENRAHTIFAFKNQAFNYLEANYQSFDPEIDGDYNETHQAVSEVFYETFVHQMPDAEIDSSSWTQDIDGLEFKAFKLTALLPNGMNMRTIMFSRLFNKREFTVNIMYIDDVQGGKMLEAWESSTFDQP